MRSHHLRWLPLLAGFGALAVSGAAHAAVVWTSTFEKGDLSEWTPGINATTVAEGGVRKNVVVEGTTVYTGKYACEITVHPDDLFGQYKQDRVDIQHQSTLTAEGKDTWISGHYMMPADAGVRNEFAFWESNVSSTNVMDFWVEPKTGGGTTVNFGVGFLGATKVWTADFAIGTWHQVAMHVHWSTNPQLGSVDVWFDGTQVVTAYKAQTKADANTLFYQNGLHRKVQQPFVDTIYIDDFIEADSLAEAQIAAPIQQDGGTGSEAGADGGAADAGSAAGSTDAGGTGASGASSGAGATSGSGATSGTGAISGTGATSGTSATGGATTGAGPIGTANRPTSGCGCAILGAHGPAVPVASAIGLIGVALARRRRRG